MKNFILMTVILLAGFIGVNAQSPQSANEGYLGYSFDENTDSHGVTVGYTRYVNDTAARNGTVGLTGELSAVFNEGVSNTVAAQGGVTLKARNYTRFQPSVRALVGVARYKVDNRFRPFDASTLSAAYTVGAGLDIAFREGSRYKFHTGVDYVNIGVFNGRTGGFRFGAGIIL